MTITRTRILMALPVALVGLAVAAALIAGSMRYGGADALMRRMQAEVMAHRPNRYPPLVPTPLPIVAAPAVAQQLPAGPGDAAAPPTTTATATAVPTPAEAAVLPEPTATHEPPPTTRPRYRPAQSTVELTGFRHMWQTWNNCGPATLAIQLSFWGSAVGQETAGAALRTHQDDKNVMPEELAAFARAQGFESRVLVNGNRERLRLLLSNGLPVLVETWLEEEPNDGMGHYRLLTGYDDAAGYWIAYDTYVTRNLRSPAGPYRGIQIPYDEFDRHWQVFNHLYVLVYPVSEAALVAELLAGESDAATMWQAALAQTEAAVTSQPGNAFAWFNLGTNLVAFGRYAEAASAYDQARRLGLPWRMLWYQFGPFVAYHSVGRHEEVLALADATLRTTTSVEEVHYWRGMALHSLGNHAAAEQAWRRALALNPRYQEALAALGEG
mgnify:CR=1 FL=1